ncbi:MAG: response regulator, partial [Deinococcus-Thermus bacterium]|nr:response regulator [Deinococcota bacterium]
PGDATIVFVDDEEVNLTLLGRILERQGYERLVSCDDPRKVPDLIREHDADLLITDIHMPGLDGMELISQVVAARPEDDWFPIAVITADLSPEAEREALSRGAKDFITKPFKATQIQLRVHNLLQTRFLHEALRRHNEHLEDLVRDRTRELETARMDLLERLALAAEFRDYVTGRHTQRVGELAALLAAHLGMPEDEVELLRRAAPLHDVGKIGIPDAILLKPGRLSDDEYGTMKEHVDVGVRLLAQGQSELMVLAEEVALSHHERWDGSGYPRGLAGDEIPLVGQIVAVADVFDTLINVRPYKSAWPVETAVAEIRRKSGSWFSPRLVEAFMTVLAENPDLLEQLEREAREMASAVRTAGPEPAAPSRVEFD